jgi:hypothetical protein
MDSPVSIDSSMAERPSMTVPSVDTFSPGRIIRISSTITDSAGTSLCSRRSSMFRWRCASSSEQEGRTVGYVVQGLPRLTEMLENGRSL